MTEVQVQKKQELDAFQDLYESIIFGFKNGITKNDMVDIIKNKRNIPEDQAAWLVNNVEENMDKIEQKLDNYKNSPEYKDEMSQKHIAQMVSGVLWAGGGIIITLVTYSAASGGGSYVITWGAVLFGIYDFLRGLFGWLKYKM